MKMTDSNKFLLLLCRIKKKKKKAVRQANLKRCARGSISGSARSKMTLIRLEATPI